MRRVILSAIALSLVLTSFTPVMANSFLGMSEQDLLPELMGPQRFTPEGFQQNKDWNAETKKVVPNVYRLKGQTYSQIDWKNHNIDEWLDIDKWKTTREYRDRTVDWRQRLEDERNLELVGRVLACKGKCKTFRGTDSAETVFRSHIKEGDELFTEENTVAWVYLMDGSLVRIGPNSAVGFIEINWSKEEVNNVIRLQKGHIFVHTRNSTEAKIDTDPETDSYSLPLMLRESNQEFFERKIQRSSDDSAKLSILLNLEKAAVEAQFKLMNELRMQNKQDQKIKRKYFVYAPNVTIDVTDSSFDLIHTVNGPSYFKRRDLSGEFKLKFRGHTNQVSNLITEEAWYEMNQSGREASLIDSPSGHLQVSELLTKRIKSLELAREYWFKEYSVGIFENLEDPKKLAVDHGYTLWKDGLSKRQQFIEEYTRRTETTNMQSLQNLVEKIKQSGENIESELSDSLYRASLNHYLFGLKKRHLNQRLQVRDMNDVQYWVWILKNGKT